MSLFERHLDVAPDRPVLVVALEGWIDAGFGATAAVAALLGGMSTEVVGTFDADALLDSRARRPVLSIEDGVRKGLTWPSITLRHGEDRVGNDLLLLVGPEPDHRWRAFTREVVEVAHGLGVRLVVGLGAFPAPVPHTRPVRLAATAPTPELAAEVGFVGGSIDVPAGAQAALEEAFTEVGVPAVGLWARVPHYVAAMPYPAASLALLEGLNSLAGVAVDAGDLADAARTSRERIDGLVGQNPEHLALVAQLEAQHDAEPPSPPFGDLPSGDELAAELERYLRDQREG